MEGRPEDISLLASGGATPSLIPVQGGGGGGGGGGGSQEPWPGYSEENSVLEAGASPNAEPIPIKGGGLGDVLSWLTGSQPSAAAVTPASSLMPPLSLTPETAFNTLWNALNPNDKFTILADTTKAAVGSKHPEDDVPAALVNNTLDAIDKQYGKSVDITDPNIQQALKYGSDAQLKAGREAYIDGEAAGLKGEALNQSVVDAMNEVERTKSTYVSPLQLSITKPIVPSSSQKMYRTYEEKTVFRNEYKLDITPVNQHPIIHWMNHIKAKYVTKSASFRTHLNNYTKHQLSRWNAVSRKTSTSATVPRAKLEGSKYVSETSLDRLAICLHNTIEHVVITPPLKNIGGFDGFKMLLRNLCDLNILKIDETNYTCKINKKVALIFSSCYDKADYSDEDSNLSELFVYLTDLEMTNSNNIFCISNYTDDNTEASQSLLNKIINENADNPSHRELPTFLSPTHVIFPYKLKNGINGIIVSGESESLERDDSTPNIFNDIYKNLNYGIAGFGVFVPAKYRFTQYNSSIIKYEYSNSDLIMFDAFKINGTPPTGDGPLDKVNMNFMKTEQRIFKFNLDKLLEASMMVFPTSNFENMEDAILYVVENPSNNKKFQIFFDRDSFIIIAELFIYLYKNIDGFVNKYYEIMKVNNEGKKGQLKAVIKNFFEKNIDYVTYIRYPLTSEYKVYKTLIEYVSGVQNIQDIYQNQIFKSAASGGGRKKKSKPKRKLQIGGGGCTDIDDVSVTGRMKALGKFDVTQISPFTILVLSLEKEKSKHPICTVNISDHDVKVNSIFTEWPNETEIADISNLEIVDIGDKTYSIRLGADTVKRNWEGYKSLQTGGATLEEYEGQYEKLLSEITTTVAELPETIGGSSEFVGGAVLDYSGISSISSISDTLDISDTDYPVKIVRKSGDIVPVNMKSTDTIGDLKNAIQTLYAIPVGLQHYFLAPLSQSGGGISTMSTMSTMSMMSTISMMSTTTQTTIAVKTVSVTANFPIPHTAFKPDGNLNLTAISVISAKIQKRVNAISGCEACTVDIPAVTNSDGISVLQSGGGGSPMYSLTYRITDVPINIPDFTFSEPSFLLSIFLDDPSAYCPAGEMPDSTSIQCIPTNNPTVHMYTTDELDQHSKFNWVPPVVAAGVGLAGLGALAYMNKNESKKKDSKNKDSIQANKSVLPETGGGPKGYRESVPILVKGEAELLNDLNLSPLNMALIFKEGNDYANKFGYTNLKSWSTAIPMFLNNLTTQKCYSNRLLLTKSECEESKCFLYSIRDYLDSTEGDKLIQSRVLEADTSEFNQDSLETDEHISLSKVHIEAPQFTKDEQGRPYVRVGAIEKRTNKRVHFNLTLTAKRLTEGEVTDEEKEQLRNMFEEKKTKYSSNYVMYLY